MRILYGVQATGNGHISRSREVVTALKQVGHDVHVIFSGREPEQLWDVQAFIPFSAYKGLTFAFAHGKIKYLQTIKNLSPIQFFQDIAHWDTESFDLVITDFEPISARIAKRLNIPSIGIGHQYAFQYPIPLAKRDPLALLVLKYFAPADYSLGLHWHHFGHAILPPIVPRIPSGGNRSIPDKILVYLPFEEIQEAKQLLLQFPDYTFYYYAAVNTPEDFGNVHLRPFNREKFINDLLTCEGVISNAGFELASEALHLGKKLLVRPLAGQMEQLSNALVLEQLHLGKAMSNLSQDAVAAWLHLPLREPISYPDVAHEIAQWICRGDWNNLDDFVKHVWSQVIWESCKDDTCAAASRTDMDAIRA